MFVFQVHLGEPNDLAGFGIAVDIEVEGVSDEGLIQDAHAVCIIVSCSLRFSNLSILIYTVLPLLESTWSGGASTCQKEVKVGAFVKLVTTSLENQKRTFQPPTLPSEGLVLRSNHALNMSN